MDGGAGRGEPDGVAGWRAELDALGGMAGKDFDGSRLGEAVGMLERIADGGALAECSRMLGEAAWGLDAEVRSGLLDGALGAVYVTREHCGALGALLGGMRITDLCDAGLTYVALDAVRVALLHAHLRAHDLGGSVEEILGSCYDALARVASRYGLDNLVALMAEAGVRESFCGEGAGIPAMARLRATIRDRRDALGEDDARGVLNRYPQLKALMRMHKIDPKRRGTELARRMALDHAVHDDYEAVHDAVLECRIRLSYWIDEIYRQHGRDSDPHLLDGQMQSAYQKERFRRMNLIVAVRYLTVELKNFRDLYSRADEMITRRLVEDPGALYTMLEGCECIAECVRDLRNRFGAHVDLTFREITARVDRITLRKIMRYARRVRLFQDAAYRAIPHRYYEVDLRAWGRPEGGEISVAPREEREAAREKYGRMDIAAKCGPKEYIKTYESFVCLLSMYAKFEERVQQVDDRMDTNIALMGELYNIKYMCLELYNIIERLEGMGLSFRPECFERKAEYKDIRDSYSAHTRPNTIRGMVNLLKEKSELVLNVSRDVVEIMHIMEGLEKKFPGDDIPGITRMTDREMESMDAAIDELGRLTHAAYDGRYIDPHEEQRRRAERLRQKKAWGMR